MKKITLLLLSFMIIGLSSADAQFLGKLKDKAKKIVKGDAALSKDEVAKGLKEALDKGVQSSVKTLSAENGYLDSQYKILIPEDAQKVVSKVKMLPGFENVERDLILKMNQAAEIAAKKATPIFKDAILDMSFDDAMAILTGEDDAATRYLEQKSFDRLYEEFMPIIIASLDEINARSYWRSVVQAYNKIPLVKDVNPELDDHVNRSALDGLFGLIEKKEEGIRTDTNQRTSALLQKVFSKQD